MSVRCSQACKEASCDTNTAGRDAKDVVLRAVCCSQALFGAIGAGGTNLMLGIESLMEWFVAAESGFSSSIDGHGEEVT